MIRTRLARCGLLQAIFGYFLIGCVLIPFRKLALGDVDASSSLQERRIALGHSTNSSSTTMTTTDQNHDDDMLFDLRILAFGTSRTYGSKLKNRLETAYPYLLSPKHATNLAIRAAGPEYPALCTYSMLGDETMADVILIEYNLKADENLKRLGIRLRQRFPSATIVLLHLWMPFQYFHRPSNRNFKQIVEHGNFSTQSYHPSHLNAFLDTTQPGDWEYQADQIKTLSEVADQIGAFIYHMPRPENPIEALRDYLPHFNYDMVHLTEDGHASLAQGLRAMLVSERVSPSNVTNEWNGLDSCQSWYETGQSERIVAHSEMRMIQFGQNKFALEIAPPSSWICFDNPLPHPVQVFLSYMITAPHQDYPSVSVTLSSKTQRDEQPQMTDIHPVENTNRYAVHVMKHKLLGTIPPGEATIHISPKELTNLPFRMTGIIQTPLMDPDSNSPITSIA